MMREPWFWRSDTITAKVISVALAPFGNLYNTVQKLKWQSAQQTLAPLPIICVGNASLGGVGKTPFAIEVQSLLNSCLLYTSPSPRDQRGSRMPSSA